MFVINATDYAPVTPVTPPCDIIPIFIGYKGENHARCLIFDLTDCIEEFGDGGFAISFMRHGDAQPYIVTDTDSLETTAIWEINATDTAVEGYGMVQLQYIVGETVCKTAMYRTITFDSNESAGDVPDPYENLLDQIAAYAAQAQASAAAAERAAVNAAAQADRIISTTADAVGDWLEDNIGEISGYVIDKSLTVSDAAADAKVAGDWIRASFITDTASGTVASFPDGADGVPVKNLSVSVQAVQSGTGDPSPSNVRSISGWSSAKVVRCGKNILENNVTESKEPNVTIVKNADGSLTINGTLTSTTIVAYNFATNAATSAQNDQTKHIPNGTYHVSTGRNNTDIKIQVVASNVSGTSSITSIINTNDGEFTIDDTYNYNWVRLYIYAGTYTNVTIYPMIRPASITDATYEPYNGNTYTITFPDAAGTVYGGTLDVTTGVLTVTYGMQKFTGANRQGSVNQSYYAYNTNEKPADVSTGDYITDAYCDCYDVAGSGSERANGKFYILDGTIIFVNDNFTSVSEANSILASQQPTVVYPLATPQTFALTPTQVTSLLGNNNIFADCGASDVTYRADPRLYLEKLTNPDSDMTADANIASGSYFMVGNRLYLATSAISLGASIVPGTNCTATDLASALNAINS